MRKISILLALLLILTACSPKTTEAEESESKMIYNEPESEMISSEVEEQSKEAQETSTTTPAEEHPEAKEIEEGVIELGEFRMEVPEGFKPDLSEPGVVKLSNKETSEKYFIEYMTMASAKKESENFARDIVEYLLEEDKANGRIVETEITEKELPGITVYHSGSYSNEEQWYSLTGGMRGQEGVLVIMLNAPSDKTKPSEEELKEMAKPSAAFFDTFTTTAK